MFGVNNDFFPEYDEGNLYNTNPNFDYGAFKDLAEKHRLMKSNSTLFSFRFTVPGVYAFKLSSNVNSKMVRSIGLARLFSASENHDIGLDISFFDDMPCLMQQKFNILSVIRFLCSFVYSQISTA